MNQPMQGCSLVSASVVYALNRALHNATLSLLAEAINCTTTIFANIVTEVEAYLVMLRLQAILAISIHESMHVKRSLLVQFTCKHIAS